MSDDPRAPLLRRLAHDLRSPLGVLKGTLEGLPALPEQARAGALRRASRAVDRLLRLADHLSLSGRAPQGFAVLRQTVEVGSVARASLESILSAEPRANLLTHAVGDARWPSDPVLLRALFDELVSNGSRWARSAISIEVAEGEAAVEDDGPGIDAARAAGIFEQAPLPPQGLGLGLPLAQALATSLGLRLSLEPAASGALSRFVIRRA